MKITKLFLSLLAAALVLVGCEKDPETVAVASVTVSPTTASVEEGKTQTITATVLPADAANKSVTWSSSNTAVATVANGVVTAVKAGTAIITVATVDGNKTATVAVTVTAKAAAVPPLEEDYFTIEGATYDAANVPAPTGTDKFSDVKIDEKAAKGIDVTVTSAVELAKIYVAVKGVAGHYEFAAVPVEGSTRADSYTYGFTLEPSGELGEFELVISAETKAGAVIGGDPVFVNEGEEPTVVAVTGVTVSPTSAQVEVGKSVSLSATVAPDNASNKKVTWSSGSSAIATVSGGVVTGVKEGTTTITVTTEDGSKTATASVTVKAAATTDPGTTDPGASSSLRSTHFDIEGAMLKLGAIPAATASAGYVGGNANKVTVPVTVHEHAANPTIKVDPNSVSLAKIFIGIKGESGYFELPVSPAADSVKHVRLALASAIKSATGPFTLQVSAETSAVPAVIYDITEIDVDPFNVIREIGLTNAALATKLAALVGSGITDTDASTVISRTEAKGVTTLDLDNVSSLASLDGLEYFTGLTSLTVQNNGDLADIAIPSALTALETLTIKSNANSGLTSLTVPSIAALKTLAIEGNTNITSLSVPSLAALESLTIKSAGLTALTLPAAENLTTLVVDNGAAVIEKLTVQNYPELATLTLTGNAGLTELVVNNLDNASLTGLTLPTTLKKLTVSGNAAITALDASGITGLTDLTVTDNAALATLDMTGCAALVNLTVSGNPLLATITQPSTKTAPVSLTINDTAVTDLALADYTAATAINLAGNNKLTKLSVTGATLLTNLTLPGAAEANVLAELTITGTALASFSVPAYPLTKFVFDNDNVTSLAVNGFDALATLTLTGNDGLQTLTVSNNKVLNSSLTLPSAAGALTALNVKNNEALTAIAVTNLTNITALDALNNALTLISDLDKLVNLTSLNVANNALEGINIKGVTVANVTSLFVSGNPGNSNVFTVTVPNGTDTASGIPATWPAAGAGAWQVSSTDVELKYEAATP